MPNERRTLDYGAYDEVSRLYEIVARTDSGQLYYDNCQRFYEAAISKLPNDVAVELGEKIAQHHPAKTYVRDTIAALLLAGMPEDQIENSLRLLFL